MKKLLIVFAGFFLMLKLNAQMPATYSSADIYLQLQKLNVLASVLYIAAHPDDENTRLLAYFSKGKLYRTGYLSLTRGDGGQNLIGDEQGIELGLIRTQELLSARRIDGAEQFFSRAYDFGFCKTADEALQTWGHDKILSDVVWVIRKFQPDVIITRFPPDERAGHGHHAASAILAKEAFFAAADKTKFPEQFQYGVQPWQAKRILWNTFNFGGNNTTSESQFKMDIGGYNPLLGKSYGEIASESRSQHKSQGFGVPRQRGQSLEYFSLTAGDTLQNDLMDGITISWDRVQGGDKIKSQISNIISHYNFEHPENSVASLVDLYKSIKQLPESYWQNKKLDEVENIIVNCSGIFAEATAPNEFAVQGDSIKVEFFVNKRSNATVSLKEVKFTNFDSSLQNELAINQNFSFSKTFLVDKNQPISQPYWLAKPLQGGSFSVDDQNLIGKPEDDPAYEAKFIFTINGENFSVNRAMQNKYTDPVKGEVYEPLFVVPPITGRFDHPLYLFDGNKTKIAELSLYSNVDLKNFQVQLKVSDAWKFSNNIFNASTNKNGQALFQTTIENIKPSAENISVAVNGTNNTNIFEERKIAYNHIPDIIYFKPLTARLEKIDVIVKGKNIGYIVGAGDKVPEALQQLGYSITYLREANVTEENLKQFDAIITGVRAYNTQPWLSAKYDVLMNYIKNGGNLIVQYNTSNNNENGVAKIGPYNFNINRTRVTDENAKVDILLPNNSALNYPNKITQKDFEGWTQERSIYQAENFDTHFFAPLGMNDPKEKESNGSLIIAPYGKGNFVYTGLVFFRELPVGVTGAYRLMVNLIALPKSE
ncbi:MAG: PIG-L family deacetylase [Chitinophagaceae bacterium]